MEKTVACLKEILGAEGLLEQESMALHTTFKTGGPADLFLMPETAQQLKETISKLRQANIPYYILGNGSNLLAGDKGYRGAMIQLYSRMQKIQVSGEEIHVECGALLSAVAAEAANASLEGFAFASGIPGTFGGAVVMNAGAYGGEMKDVLVSVDVLTKDLEVLSLPAEELELSYRHSIVPEKEYIVLGGVIRLKKGNQEKIREEMAELAKQRREKQPLQYPSAGSTFKRPQGYFAGKLISDAGLKGRSVGGAQVSEKHAGFLVNKGGATTQDILDLIRICQDTVWEQFGVKLETEVKFIGEQ
ncbi:UDP-N-acetylmuramate dehydrogenase [Anaerotignum lactatifermentans]|uniref:UDP-N-acetylenolpyruvoylglucosamine reductase n=1 Tax=Anaerotignum lactatifermentans TaxID=160404 RepID=A0ABS2G856_9FIRM|nr:UDP-N-acetylmuramate dehydrogenase [Anaerotignum lactatifermentans]MBM6828364.1 UDP-N-acetylmuramate dehydrogenase [Anaerotignum lactatifermentans]MBM6877644.1 UDP-N-acetylmuramate dehydrogenase [Anaerotignum lactatifermentans]MBM6949947.1 UDP-N-acetylmuramate dehydrogenase [Anaerotignum lactatifermentans]